MSEANNHIELSIIIPNYNNANYLSDCLNSILNQTFKNYEIIICDDCSSDGSIDVINKYTSKYPFIRAVYHKSNIGVAKNRHSGILEASCRFITTIDADDIYYEPRKLEEEMRLVNKHINNGNESVCTFSKIALLNKNLNYVIDQWPVNEILEGNIFKEIITRKCMIPRDFIFTKEAYFNTGGFDPASTPYEDWDLKTRLAKNNEFYFTGIYGTGYRQHEKGLSKIGIPDHIKILKRVFYKNLSLVEDENIQEIKHEFLVMIKKMKELFLKEMEEKRIKCLKEGRYLFANWLIIKKKYYNKFL